MDNIPLHEQVRERMEVVDSMGVHVGTVDHVEGDRIRLTKSDSTEQRHHSIPADLIERVDDRVHLGRPSAEVKRNWEPA
jgi:hypothetical protein